MPKASRKIRARDFGPDPEQNIHVETFAGDHDADHTPCTISAAHRATHFIRITSLKTAGRRTVRIRALVATPTPKIEFIGPAHLVPNPTEWQAEIPFYGDQGPPEEYVLGEVDLQRNGVALKRAEVQHIVVEIWHDKGSVKNHPRPPERTYRFQVLAT
jgi:hypothetical protein